MPSSKQKVGDLRRVSDAIEAVKQSRSGRRLKVQDEALNAAGAAKTIAYR